MPVVKIHDLIVNRHRCGDDHRPAELFLTGRHIESVQAMHEFAVLLRLHNHVQRARCKVDDRRGHDPDLGEAGYITAGLVSNRHTRDACTGIDKACQPQRRGICTLVVVGVKGINTIVLRGNIDDVMSAGSRDNNIA